jgi:tRNA/tmRNA/rRNA uracil-C5-methylase (TrmA/RlmC/RlmD family)
MAETLTPFDSGAARKPRWGDECSVRFERLDERGHSVGEVGDFRLLERGGALGALARVRVLSRRRSDLEVRTLEVLEPGPHTVPARCVHHGVCGGCTFQATAYGAQLEFRARALQEVLSAAGVAHGLDEVVASPEVWNYRNKMDFTFGTRRWSEVAGADVCPGALTLGLFPRGVHSKVLEIRRCEIAFGAAAAIVESTRRLARDLCFDAYDTVAQGGFLRHLLLRRSWADGEILAALVTTAEAPAAGPEAFAALVEALAAAHPEVTTWVQLVNPGRALVAVGEREIVLRGRGAIRERLAGHDFEVRAGSFFQVNTPAAEALIERVLAAADVRPGGRDPRPVLRVRHDLPGPGPPRRSWRARARFRVGGERRPGSPGGRGPQWSRRRGVPRRGRAGHLARRTRPRGGRRGRGRPAAGRAAPQSGRGVGRLHGPEHRPGGLRGPLGRPGRRAAALRRLVPWSGSWPWTFSRTLRTWNACSRSVASREGARRPRGTARGPAGQP